MLNPKVKSRSSSSSSARCTAAPASTCCAVACCSLPELALHMKRGRATESGYAHAQPNPGGTMSVLVETEPVEGTPRGAFTLTLWGEAGKRPIILGDIKFP
ncbi:DUF2381 family protein [Corallococcus praedator]|uniref:DUF2381 family protein n=1 Tax=Corallococcus praedator TaxID=2316724 RepID=A0ABX9QFR2_9BACT|nr:DUF2381 family protein [Corallococcus sp. CA031C]RKI06672.1 DUF2381 family protein [Corallococcus praedator]